MEDLKILNSTPQFLSIKINTAIAAPKRNKLQGRQIEEKKEPGQHPI